MIEDYLMQGLCHLPEEAISLSSNTSCGCAHAEADTQSGYKHVQHTLCSKTTSNKQDQDHEQQQQRQRQSMHV